LHFAFLDAAYAHLAELSRQGLGLSTPNPNVSAAIYSTDGQLIADGFHNKKISPDHAEVVAIKKAGDSARGATIVVSLEPCAHTGSTPPCTQAIIEAGIAHVIYAVKDPNPIAAGGAEVLKGVGIKVEFIPSAELEFVQRGWLHKIKTGDPLLIWKVAATLDGRIAAADGTSKWITNESSRADVQLLRSQSDAILIGTNTALIDNPHLIPRGYDQRPVRIICGLQEIPATHKIFDEEAKTVHIKSKSLTELMEFLRKENFNHVLVEAGPTFGSALIAGGLIDEVILYQAPKLLGAGKNFLTDIGIETLEKHVALELLSVEQLNGDIKSHYSLKGR